MLFHLLYALISIPFLALYTKIFKEELGHLKGVLIFTKC